jgi:hypothetical protein
MLKRFSFLILALMVSGSVLAGTTRLHDEHVCKMTGVEMMPGGMGPMLGMKMMPRMATMPGMEMMVGMEGVPCCEGDETQSVVSESGPDGECCITIPQEPGSSGTTFNLRPPSFGIALVHPAIVQSPFTLPKPCERSYSTRIFLPNLQATYIRNLSFLI